MNSISSQTTLITGGARSGKTGHALSLTLSEGSRFYIATAQALDEEMSLRIERHRLERGKDFTTLEEPLELLQALNQAKVQGAQHVVVDCVTLWLSNLLALNLTDDQIAHKGDQLAQAILNPGFNLVLVTNEVGLGIVPENALARRFRDLAGRLNQQLASCAHRVILMSCGLPLNLK